MLVLTLHVLSILLLLYSLTDASIPKALADHFNSQKGGRNQFLTIIGVQLTIFTLLLSILKYKRAHNFFYPIALATEFTISITFWFFYFTNPGSLMRPIPEVDVLLPFYMDVVYHALPLAALIIEAFYIDLTAFQLSPCTFAMVPISYYIWAAYLSKSNGVWPYPMLDNMSSTVRMVYFLFYTLIGIAASHVFISIVRRIRGHRDDDKHGDSRPIEQAAPSTGREDLNNEQRQIRQAAPGTKQESEDIENGK